MPDIAGAHVLVQVYDMIKLLGFEFRDQLLVVLLEKMDLCEVRIRLQDRDKLLLRKVMDLHLRQLLFQATDHRRSKDDIADGAEPYYQNLLHNYYRSPSPSGEGRGGVNE